MKKFKVVGQDERVKMKLSHFGTIEECHINTLNKIVEQGDCRGVSCVGDNCPFYNFGNGVSKINWFCDFKKISKISKMAKRLLKLIDKEGNNGK